MSDADRSRAVRHSVVCGVGMVCRRSCDFFFFQAEDGIRDLTVTGVQTCALPISLCEALERMRGSREDVADNIWRAALRTVDESVRAHSDLLPGEKTYLQFIEPYV